MSSYVNEIKSIDAELKRLRERSSKLREQKQKAQSALYFFMKNNRHETYEGFKIDALAPKPKKSRKSAKQKKADAIVLFQETGIPDPENFWNSLQSTQKSTEQKDD